MALVYDRKKEFPVDPGLNPLRFKRKRPVGRPKRLGLALTKEPPLLPGGLEGRGGPGGEAAQGVAGQSGAQAGGAQTGASQGGGEREAAVPRAVWLEILANAGDIGQLQAVGGDESLNERDERGGSQEARDGTISQEEEETTEMDLEIDMED